MVNTLPAVIVGGPPHMGKSVLFYNLARALREKGVVHHAIRACPDGEGNWSQEVEQARAQEIRKKGEWSNEFITSISRDIEQRLLPLLIDVGGRPQSEQDLIFQQCTHAILLLPTGAINRGTTGSGAINRGTTDSGAINRRATDSMGESSTSFWLQVVERNGLLLLAQLYSELDGISTLQAKVPIIRGTIAGLERGTRIQGELFEAIVERIATLFRSYTEGDLELEWLYRAPTEIAIKLQSSLNAIAPGETMWQPMMIARLLERLPANTPLSVYGAGPQWLYAALAAYVGTQRFYQFDPRLGEQGGWIAPPTLQIETRTSPDIEVKTRPFEDATILDIKISNKHLDYMQSNGLPFPPISSSQGVIINGSTPAWLVTALVRLYVTSGISWIASHAVNLKGAVVVYSCVETHKVGDVIAFPA